MTGSESTPGVPEPSAGDTLIQPGARFGDLTLLRQLGRGAQGVVWEAHQKSLERRVAVKILPGQVDSNDEQIERFHREAAAAGRLAHTSIVAVYGFAELGGHRLILQELVTGGSLESAIEDRHKSKPATDAEDCRWAADICRQLALALDHAHQHKVVHRDIKPGNVLISAAGVPKIADFGLAKVADMFDLSQTGTMMGTPHYMSPEQVAARQDGVDARTDVYSLGAMLYRMIARQVPFSGDSLQKLFMDILSREPKPPRKLQPGVDADLEAVCLKALEKSPERRYATAQAFADDLQRFLDGEPTVARPVGAVGRVARSLGSLATSTLAAIALLVPTAWFAADVLLHAQAGADVRRHDWRFVLAALAAVVLCWPLGHLGVRLARGRRWAAAPACAVAVLLGWAAAFMIREQKTTQLHLADRQALAQELRLETVGSRKSVADLERYIAAWEPRFDGDDFMLLARGFLKRERPVRAGEWAGRLLTASDSNPVHVALLCAVDAALGHDEQAQAESARLADMEASAGDSASWEQIGSILLDMKRCADARTAWLRAGHLPGANRDQLNLELAQASAGLCAWDQAAESLHDFMKWQPDDPAAVLLALQIAIAGEQWEDVDEQLARIAANTRLPQVSRLQQQRNVLSARGDISGAGEHLRRTLKDAGTDAEMLDWCGTSGLDQATRDVAHAADWLGLAHDAYARLLDSGADPLIARVGLAAADIKLALKDASGAPALLDDAVDQSRHAIELDPSFYEGHHNLGTALLYKALFAHGQKPGELTAGELSAITDALQNSLQYNGLQPVTLNDTAFALSLSFGRDRDERHLHEALGLAQRAIALRQPERGTACAASDQEREQLSSCYDTLAGLQELLHDPTSALASARLALATLHDGDRSHDKRRDNVTRLAALLSNQ